MGNPVSMLWSQSGIQLSHHSEEKLQNLWKASQPTLWKVSLGKKVTHSISLSPKSYMGKIMFLWPQFSHSVLSDSLQPMDCSTPGFPIHHQLLELAQTHVYWVSEAIQPSHPLLLSPSPPTFNLSQHQGFSQGVSSSHQVAKVLKLQLQHQSFQWIFRTDWFPLGLTGFNSLQSKGLSRVFSNTTVQKHQFFGTQLSLWYNSHISHHLQWFWSPRK